MGDYSHGQHQAPQEKCEVCPAASLNDADELKLSKKVSNISLKNINTYMQLRSSMQQPCNVVLYNGRKFAGLMKKEMLLISRLGKTEMAAFVVGASNALRRSQDSATKASKSSSSSKPQRKRVRPTVPKSSRSANKKSKARS